MWCFSAKRGQKTQTEFGPANDPQAACDQPASTRFFPDKPLDYPDRGFRIPCYSKNRELPYKPRKRRRFSGRKPPQQVGSKAMHAFFLQIPCKLTTCIRDRLAQNCQHSQTLPCFLTLTVYREIVVCFRVPGVPELPARRQHESQTGPLRTAVSVCESGGTSLGVPGNAFAARCELFALV